MTPDGITNLGTLGRFYSARMVLGFYRTTAALMVTSYLPDGPENPDSRFKERFYNAIFHTIKTHPALCWGIVDETPEKEAHFRRLSQIGRDDVVQFHGQSDYESSGVLEDESIVKILEDVHRKRLLDGHRFPGWRVIIFKHGSEWDKVESPETQRISIVFLAHHAIADGISHFNFHRTLLHFLNRTVLEKAPWPLEVPRDTPAPVLLEDAVDLLSRDENNKAEIDYTSPNIWAGNRMFLNSVDDYESGLRFITVSSKYISKLLMFCRIQGITLTGLLHGLIVAFLSRKIPLGHKLLAVTPYSMRYLTKASREDICNHSGGFTHEFSENLVSNLRDTQDFSRAELCVIVEAAKIYGSDMAAEIARSPKNNAWAALFGVKNWYAPSKSQLGKKRVLSYELPNLGNIEFVNDVETGKENLKVEKLLVSQSGSVTGPVFSCNCVSMKGGPFTATFSWQRGSLEDDMIDSLASHIQKRMEEGFDGYLLDV